MINYSNYLTPSCEILVNGQKRKLYGKNKNKVYLNDGDEFQLKVYNPLSERVGFQLKMNGTDTDNSILVVNPGQSVVVERFIGTNRKLKFSTYVVDKNNPTTKQAIKENGKLEVTFWNEFKTYSTGTVTIQNPIWVTQPYIPNCPPTTTPSNYYYCGDSSSAGWTTNCGTANGGDNTATFRSVAGTPTSSNYDCEIKGDLNITGNLNVNGVNMTPNTPNWEETGRIEKGKKSNQHFSQTEFVCGYIIKTYCFKLLSFSEKKKEVQQPYQSAPYQTGPFNLQNNPYIVPNANLQWINTSYVKSEGREYCPNKRCGYRVRNKNYGWCPMCGTKLI